jgi:Putative restriction endonuclease
MAMSTVTDWRDVDDDFDPDTLKMPDNPRHRRIIEAIGVAADTQVDSSVVVYRDMNWYPPDGGNAVAPDIMVLPSGVIGSDDNSYRQPTADLPFPLAVIEVPSSSDTFDGLRAKAARYGALAVDVYIISTQPTLGVALRLVPGTAEFIPWTGQPIAPLGGLTVEVADGDVIVRTLDGRTFTSAAELVGLADARAAIADERAATAEARATMLEAKLRSLGIQP